MFDSTFLIDRLADVWQHVFNANGMNTDNIYKYHNYRNLSVANVPSVVLMKRTGVTNIANDVGTMEYKRGDGKLLKLWNRQDNIEMTIIGNVKNEADAYNQYPERLLSLFLREFERGNIFDAGTSDALDSTVDQIREVQIVNITDNTVALEELEIGIVAKLIVVLTVQYYEYAEV